MAADSNTDGQSVSILESPFIDVDLISVDELINSATQLLDEVYQTRPRPTQVPTTVLDARDEAMDQVQKFLNSIREPDPNQDDDVVFVEARAGNVLPSNARTTAVVNLCTPDADEPVVRRRGRRSAATTLTPQVLFQGGDSANSADVRPKTRKRQPKKEPGTASAVVINDSISSADGVHSPDGSGLPRLTCAVCMESVVNRQPSSTSCGHIFCQKCIFQAITLTRKCPLCNCKLKRNQVHRVYF